MSVILVLIPLSIVCAAGFLGAFIWAVRSGQYEDTCTPSMRLLFDDSVKKTAVPRSEPPSPQPELNHSLAEASPAAPGEGEISAAHRQNGAPLDQASPTSLHRKAANVAGDLSFASRNHRAPSPGGEGEPSTIFPELNSHSNQP